MQINFKAKMPILFLIILLCANSFVFATRKTRNRKSLAITEKANDHFRIVEINDAYIQQELNNFTPKLKEIVKKHNKNSFYGLTREEIRNCRIVTQEQLLQEEEQFLQQKVKAFAPRLKEILTTWNQNKLADFSTIQVPIIHEPSPESPEISRNDYLDSSDEDITLELPNGSGKEKEKEDDFFVVETKHHDSLWTEEDLAQLPTLPFGQFLKAELEARNKQLIASQNERTVDLEEFANISMTGSLIEGLSDLAKKRDTTDLSVIDDEEWGIIDALPETKFQDYHWKSKMINVNKKQNGVIVFFLIHGTFVDHNEFGKDNETKMTQDLINVAKRLALDGGNPDSDNPDDKGCAVKLISFQWSGELSAASRKEGANILKRFFISDEDCMRAHKVTAFSHSFGGDVLLQFADLLKPYNKTLDWVVMAGTPLGESTKLDPVEKKARMLEYTDPEQCFNIKKVFQFFSRGDITQAAGSRQMTFNLLNPLGTAERRLPLRINHDRNVVNCHVEHNGELCSHVNIKWHVAASLHLLLPMIEDRFPHAHDLNVATCDDNKAHLPIITLRNLVFSSDSAEANHRSFQTSAHGEELFKKFYKKKIGIQNNWTAAKAYHEVTHAGYSQNDQGRVNLHREKMAQMFEN